MPEPSYTLLHELYQAVTEFKANPSNATAQRMHDVWIEVRKNDPSVPKPQEPGSPRAQQRQKRVRRAQTDVARHGVD